MWLAQAFKEWHEFYLLLGTAGATLVGLLFVAVSLGAGFLNDKRANATRAFFTPVVIHFAAVFFISMLSLVPSHEGVRLCGADRPLCVDRRRRRRLCDGPDLTHTWTRFLEDHLAYGLLPVICYAALLVASANES